MLVEMTRLRRLPWSPWPVADLELEAGRATLPWRGADSDAPGAYVVEWTIETSLVWGHDVSPATAPEPRVLPRADHLLVRGRWTAAEALDVGSGALDIGGSPRSASHSCDRWRPRPTSTSRPLRPVTRAAEVGVALRRPVTPAQEGAPQPWGR